MAREVNTVLSQIISEQRGVPEAKGEEIVKNMRAANQYQVRLRLNNASRHVPRVAANKPNRRMCGHDKIPVKKHSLQRCEHLILTCMKGVRLA
jgi:hypothetical protein